MAHGIFINSQALQLSGAPKPLSSPHRPWDGLQSRASGESIISSPWTKATLQSLKLKCRVPGTCPGPPSRRWQSSDSTPGFLQLQLYLIQVLPTSSLCPPTYLGGQGEPMRLQQGAPLASSQEARRFWLAKGETLHVAPEDPEGPITSPQAGKALASQKASSEMGSTGQMGAQVHFV
jgi:hypothetical protein